MVDKKIIRKKKPNFVRQDTNKTKRLKKVWRKPKGLHSKIRLNKKGHAKSPSQGYRSPKNIRRKKHILVHALKDLENVKEVVIAKTVGKKKKLELLKKAKELGVNVLNINIDEFVKKVEEELKKKKESRKTKVAKREKKKKEAEKKEETKKEEKKDEEKEKKEISKKLAKDAKQKPTEIVDNAPKAKPNVHRATAPKQK